MLRKFHSSVVLDENEGYSSKELLASLDGLEAAVKSGEITSNNAFIYALNMAELFFQREELDIAFNINLKALNIIQNIEDKSAIAEVFYNMANIYYAKKRLELSVEYLEKARKAANSSDYELLAQIHFSLGELEDSKGNHEQAKKYYDEAQKLFIRKAEMEGTRGDEFTFTGEFKQARRHYKDALQIYVDREEPVKNIIADLQRKIGTTYLRQRNYKKAIRYFNDSLRINKSENNISEIIGLYRDIGEVYFSMKEARLAYLYAEKALTLVKSNPSAYAHPEEIHILMAVIFNLHVKREQTELHFNLALDLIKSKPDSDKSMISWLQRYTQTMGARFDSRINDYTIKLCDLALDKATKVYGQNHLIIASLFKTRGTVFSSRNELPMAIADLQKALNIYEAKQDLSDDFALLETRFELASVYLYRARMLPKDEAESYYKLAEDQLLKIHHVNMKVIAANPKNSSFVEHDKVLELLSEIYCKQNRVEEAGELYADIAKLRLLSLPGLALNYINKSLEYYKCSPNANDKIFELYIVKANICYSQKRFRYAIKCLRSACILAPDNNELNSQLASWEKEEKERSTYIDEDISAQLEQCADLYQQMQLSYVNDTPTTSALSEYNKNISTEIIIKLRNILDIAFQRTAKTLVYDNNGLDETKGLPELYYPCAGSEAALQKDLINQQLMGVLSIVDSKLQITKIKLQDIEKELKDKKYIDNAGYVTDFFTNNLNNLGASFDPYRAPLIELLTTYKTSNPPKPLTKDDLGKDKKDKGKSKYDIDPPIAKKVKDALQKCGAIKEKQLSPGVNALILEGIEDDDFINKLRRELDQGKVQHGTFARSIVEMLREIVNAYKNARYLDKDFKDVYQVLKQSQPFFFYREEQNQPKEIWRSSWFDKIHAISNDSKHVRLTPLGVNREMTKAKGFTTQQDNLIYIHYMEGRFYTWSFLKLILQTENLPYDKAIEHSRLIYHWLIDEKYITDPDAEGINIKNVKGKWQVVNHPIAVEIKKVHKKYINLLREQKIHPQNKTFETEIQKLDEDIVRLQTEFLNKLNDDLPAKLKPYSKGIMGILIQRVLKRGHLSLIPDQLVPLNILLSTSMTETRDIVTTFGKACKKLRSLHPDKIGKTSSIRAKIHYAKEPLKAQYQILEEIKTRIISEGNTDLNLLSDYHRYLKTHAKASIFDKKSSNASHAYIDAARVLRRQYPSISLMYYRKALRYLPLDHEDFRKHYETTVKEYIDLCWHLGLNETAINACMNDLNSKIPPSNSNAHYVSDYLVTHFNKEFQFDKDISSQYHHVIERYHELVYLSLKLGCNPEDSYLVDQIQNGIAELIIKLRQLLDQCFTRLVKATVYWPREVEETDVPFPCRSSKETLIKDLEAREIFNNPEGVSLSPKAIDILMEAQPAEGDHKHWLVRLIKLSNQLKHVCITFPTPDKLYARWNNEKSLLDFYPISCRRGMPWEREVKERDDISALAFLGTVLDNTKVIMEEFYGLIEQKAPQHLGFTSEYANMVEGQLAENAFQQHEQSLVASVNTNQEEKERKGKYKQHDVLFRKKPLKDDKTSSPDQEHRPSSKSQPF